MSNLEYYSDKPVRRLLAQPKIGSLTEAEKEKHRIFCLLVGALTYHYWNSLKFTRHCLYPLNPSSTEYPQNCFLEETYFGHNICAIIVDNKDQVIDFDFNHNDLYKSTSDHAEARLIRRVYSLVERDAKPSDNPIEIPSCRTRYQSRLQQATVYTSLESCAQCSGIMTLAGLDKVIYLQDDPGQYKIGNILRRMTEGLPGEAPLPIPGNRINFPYYKKLNQSFKMFKTKQENKIGSPFYIENNKDKFNSSITSFLCTKTAFLIFKEMHDEFQSLIPEIENNSKIIKDARVFYQYAISRGFRGTPHL